MRPGHTRLQPPDCTREEGASNCRFREDYGDFCYWEQMMRFRAYLVYLEYEYKSSLAK